MKLKHIAVSLALIGTAFGGSVLVSNNSGSTTQSVVDNAGNIINSGYAAFGTLSDPGADFGALDGAGLAALFTPLGEGTLGVVSSGLISVGGVYSLADASLNFDTSPLAGGNIYLVLGDGASLSESNSAGIIELGTLPNAEPATLDITVNNGRGVIFGDYSRAVSPGSFLGNPIAPQPAFALGALVPEPSTSLLAGLAGLALLIRRKR